MINLIIFALAVVGLVKIIVDSDMPLIVWIRDIKVDPETEKEVENSGLFSQGWLRRLLRKIPSPFGSKWDKILDCYQCCGTWCGFVCGYVLLSHNPLAVLMLGFAGSYVAQVGVVYLEYLQAKTLISLKDE